jgi:hypothetical protein
MNLEVFPQVCALTAVEQQHNNNPTATAIMFMLALSFCSAWQQPQTKTRKTEEKTRPNPTKQTIGAC